MDWGRSQTSSCHLLTNPLKSELSMEERISAVFSRYSVKNFREEYLNNVCGNPVDSQE